MDFGIITKEFLEKYSIILVNSMYGNLDTALLWLRLLAKYVIKGSEITRIQTLAFSTRNMAVVNWSS